MFRPQYFKPADKDKLNKLHHEYEDAILERTKNPSDFDVNINCLKRIENMHIEWKNLIQPLLDEEERQHKHQMKAGGLEIKFTTKSPETALVKSKKIIFPENKKDFFARQLAIEPRINQEGNTIYFSDGTELKFTSLKDQTELDNAKKVFTDKMQELAPKPSPSFGSS